MRTLFNYFLRGLLFVFPVGATFYIIVASVAWTNQTFNQLLVAWFNLDIPGLGILIVFLAVSLIGFLFSSALVKPIFRFFDRTIARMPLVKIIYTSIKELTEAFVGEKRKFNKPVIVEMSDDMYKLGFITEQDLGLLKLKDLIAVYCPHSYNFSGNLFLVPQHRVKPVKAKAADVMKFIVSAGVTQLSAPPEETVQP